MPAAPAPQLLMGAQAVPGMIPMAPAGAQPLRAAVPGAYPAAAVGYAGALPLAPGEHRR